MIPDHSALLSAAARTYIPGGVNSATRALDPPLVFTRAAGSRITDADGREYIDYHAAFGPILLGHRHPGVNEQVRQALERLDLVGVGVTETEIQLARKICTHVPSAEKVLLCVTGSEATFHAVRLARAVTGRKKIIKFQGCFHGWHDYLAMNVISPAAKLGRFDPCSAGMLEEAALQTLVVPFNSLDDLEDTLALHKGQVAAIILEPIPHNVGCLMPAPGFLAGVRQLATIHGALLIFDEVITGFRHGLGGYQERCGVTPDLTTLGKSMANGYPCAALCGRASLMDRFQNAGGDVLFAGTYNAYSAGVAAALATIAELEDGRVHERLFEKGAEIARELTSMIERHGLRAQVAQFGSVFVIYFMEGPIRTYADLLRNDKDADLAFRRGMGRRGNFLLPLALKRNHLTAAHSDEDIASTLNAAEDVLKSLAG